MPEVPTITTTELIKIRRSLEFIELILGYTHPPPTENPDEAKLFDERWAALYDRLKTEPKA